MYRYYENPYKLQDDLTRLEEEFHRMKSLGYLDVYEEIDYMQEIWDLKDRIRFAWDDEEYDENNAEYYEGDEIYG